MALLSPSQIVEYWWNLMNPDARSKAEDIESGLRAPLVGSTDKIYVTSPCQYWVKGLPAVCKSWSDSKCVFSSDEAGSVPSGYSKGVCDGLGRRGWCSEYEAGSAENIDEYVCVLPCLEKSGFGKQSEAENSYVSLIPFAISEIKGYNNEGGNSVGRCDGKGMGRGSAGFNVADILELYKKRPVCRHYRPWSMGFGAVVPRPTREVLPTTTEELHDGSPSDPLMPMEKRLPFAFDIYNQRARFQKCAHWDADFGLPFSFNENSSAIALEDDPASLCSCADEASTQYKTISSDWPENVPYILTDVWAEYGGIVCNGAKPECPCYTGKWEYCIDDYMRDGMRITSNQLLELRFWTSIWDNQKDYDDYFQHKPGITSNGVADETTSDIYTFTYWEKLDPIDPNESIMVGKKQRLCVPTPPNNRVFDPQIYILTEEIKYPKLDKYYGTHGPGEVNFPTLVRELEPAENTIPGLDIIYPYSSKNPWDVIPCSKVVDDDCIHSHNKMILPGPKIGVLGHSIRRKPVFVINTNLVTKHSILLDMISFTRMDKVPTNKRSKFNLEISTLLKTLDKDISNDVLDGFNHTRTDDNGFFELGSVKLRYEQVNTLIIICRYDEENNLYNFRIRKVRSKYYGGYIAQNEFTYDIDNSSNSYLPTGFYPAPTLSAEVKTTNGKVVDVFAVHSFLYKGTIDEYVSMSYCINAYTEEEENVKKWTQIGMSTYILAEIDNIDLTYLFDFEIIEANLVPTADDGAAGLCGDSSSVSLQWATITTNLSLLERDCIPPNAVLLKTNVVGGFKNNKWQLSIKYKFKKLETFVAEDSGESEAYWPEGITDTDEGYYRFIEAPFTITLEDSDKIERFTINGNHSIAYAVMAYIADDDNRIQSATATKLLTCVNYSGCRNIDIFYKYTADAVGWELQPNNGFLIWRGADRTLSDGQIRTHGHTPLCGDHECSPSNCIGPMWFPYNNCSTEVYNVRLACNYCIMPIVEGASYTNTHEAAWRYCQAQDYDAWVGVGGNSFSACGSSWKYYYSKATAGSMRFSGYARIRGPISVPYYTSMGWALPPFGNTGREYTERWLSKDYESYIDLSLNPPRTRAEYMPHVIDDTDIYMDLNCFSRANWHGQVNEPFFHLSQLNLFTAMWINETHTSTRKRFDEVFDIIEQSKCSYPPPEYGESGLVTKRYGFKNDQMCWAWQEWWENIDRYFEKKLLFLKLVRPEYRYDYDKKEHRLITYEGAHSITFIPPLKADYDLKSTGLEYPSICLDVEEHQRFFKILYNDSDYLSTNNVEWMDENTMYEFGSNPVDGEGGVWGFIGDVWSWISNMGDTNETIVWAHDINTLFDEDASSSKDDDRKIVMSEDSAQDQFFNRGIIANVPKSRLKYLPLLELGFSGMFGSDNVCTIGKTVLRYNVPINVTITGQWGRLLDKESNKETNYCLPSVTVAERHSDDTSSTADHVIGISSSKDSRQSYTEGAFGKLYDYKLILELSTLPTHIMKEVDFFTITLGGVADEIIKVDSLSGVMAYYTQSTEFFKTYERKYITSLINKDDVVNPDGANTSIYRAPSPSDKSNGQYFPLTSSSPLIQNETKSADKMTMVGAGKFYPDNTSTSVVTPFAGGGGTTGGGGTSGAWGSESSVGDQDSIKECGPLSVTVGNLKTIEKEEQKKLYEDSVMRDDYDVLTLSPYIPPKFTTFMEKIGLKGRVAHKTLTIKSNKLLWDKHWLFKSLIQDGLEFFTLGGHYFTWSDYVFKTRCMIFGPVESVYSVVFVHHRHGSSVATATAYEAYAGWVRIGYMAGRIAQVEGAAKPRVDLLTAAQHGS